MPTATTANTGRARVQGRAGSPLPTRERRPSFVILGVVLIVGLAGFGAWLYSSAGAKTPVVVVVQSVPAGHAITRADVSTVEVAGAVTAIAGKNLDSVIGQSAAVALLPNMLLQRSMVAAASGLSPQEAEVGVAVTSGQVPADGLEPGDTVQVLQLPGDGAASSRSAPGPGGEVAQELVGTARVFAVRADPAQAGGTLLTLTVPSSQAALVATASGAGKVALVRVAADQ
jgi:hypothetical protein